MTNPGPFQLIINDGRQDHLIFARDILLKNLDEAAHRRVLENADAIPTLSDVASSHVLYTTRRYKPHVQVTMEYRKEVLSGTHSLGNELRFELSHFGDLFSDMFLMVNLDASDVFTFEEIDQSEKKPLIRWCDYPGERLLEEVTFEVNGAVIDSYTSDMVTMERQFETKLNKRKQYNTLVGQENIEKCWLSRNNVKHNADGALNNRFQIEVANGLQTPKWNQKLKIQLWIPLLFWFNKDFKQPLISVAMPNCQRLMIFKTCNPRKLLGLVPNPGDAYVENESSSHESYMERVKASGRINFNYANLKITNTQLYINNLFFHPEIHTIYLSQIAFNLVYVHTKQIFNVNNEITEVKLNQLQWPTVSIYCGIKLDHYHQGNNEAMFKYMDLWNKYSLCQKREMSIADGLVAPDNLIVTSLSTAREVENDPATTYLDVTAAADSEARVCIDKLNAGSEIIAKWYNPTSTRMVSMRGIVKSVTASDDDTYVRVALDGSYLDKSEETANMQSHGQIILPKRDSDSKYTNRSLNAWRYEQVPLIDRIRFTVHSIELFDWGKQFLREYTTWRYGGDNLFMPEDPGLLMINFAMHPGKYQPSGHLNISRARESYLEIKSSTIGKEMATNKNKTYTGVVYLHGKAINFMLVSDGCASIRYMT